MKMKMQAEQRLQIEPAVQPQWLQLVREQVSNLRFGTVQIVVHDGRVTQVDSTQRTRLAPEVTEGR
jgi:hypothetical protein